MLTMFIIVMLINTPFYIYEELLSKGIDISFLYQPYHDFLYALLAP